jgi:peptidoglycan/xylan/chitin deacetylase (PgdA/CDA1 family)
VSAVSAVSVAPAASVAPAVSAASSASVPEAAWRPDEFAGAATDDWLLGHPFRLVPRQDSAVVRRYPRGRPMEGGFPGRRLLMTFDDGPFPETTPRLLDILAAEQVDAVFFVVAWRVDEIPQRRHGRRIVERMLAEGHTVGNHSHTHPHLPALGEAGWKRQILKAHSSILSITGYAPTLFRPPYGQFNGAIDRYLTYRGYTRVHWTYPADEFRGRPAEVVARGILEQIRVRERGNRNVGGIVLLHDIHQRSVDAARLLIRRLKAENCSLLDAGDEDLWRFVEPSEFFQPAGVDGRHSIPAQSLAADHAVRKEARRWCDAHAGELADIRRLDDVEVNINESGFGGVATHDAPDDGTPPD